jgi:hypothetical protein
VAARLLLGLLLAQAPAADATESARLERIRKALAETPALVVAPATPVGGPVFKVTIRGRRPDPPLWVDFSAVPNYVRPQFPPYHFEFLQQVATEEIFRAGILYPTGAPLVTVGQFIARQVKAANRKRREANAKDEVRRALAELLACRANPDRPGC